MKATAARAACPQVSAHVTAKSRGSRRPRRGPQAVPALPAGPASGRAAASTGRRLPSSAGTALRGGRRDCGQRPAAGLGAAGRPRLHAGLRAHGVQHAQVPPLAPQKVDLPPRQTPEHQLLTAQAAGPQDHGPLAPWPFAARCSSHLSALQAEGESSDGQRAPSSQPGQPFTESAWGWQGTALSPQRPSSRDRPGHTKDCTQDPWHPLSFREGCRPSLSLSGPASHLHLPQGTGGHWVSGASSAEGTGANSDPTF